MYKALNYWVFGGFAGERTPYEFISFAAEQKLDGVELTVGDALKIDITEDECRKIASFAKEKRIRLRTLATGFYWGCSLSSTDESERRNAIEFSLKYLQIAKWIGAESVLIVPGAARVAWDESRPVVSYKTTWENSVRSLRELIPAAKRLEVNIALENVWNRFLLSPMEWKYYLDQFDSEYLGIYFDVGNCCLYGRPQDYVEILGSKIKAVHLKNFMETDCGGGLHGFGDKLLEGEVDFTALFLALESIGYKGPLTVEMIPFSRLPDLKLPDQELALRTTEDLRLL